MNFKTSFLLLAPAPKQVPAYQLRAPRKLQRGEASVGEQIEQDHRVKLGAAAERSEARSPEGVLDERPVDEAQRYEKEREGMPRAHDELRMERLHVWDELEDLEDRERHVGELAEVGIGLSLGLRLWP